MPKIEKTKKWASVGFEPTRISPGLKSSYHLTKKPLLTTNPSYSR